MTNQERWLVVLVAFLFLFGSAVRRYRSFPAERIPPESVDSAAADDGGGDERERADGERIDLNRCSARDLEDLPGLGPVLARRVIEWRETHGPFRSVEDLVRVRGIGPKTMGRVRCRVAATPTAVREREPGNP